MVTSKKFTTASPVLVNFDQQDIASGTGITTYLACIAEDTTGTQPFLTKDTPRSQEIETFIETTSSTVPASIDFDLTVFEVSQTVRGTAVLTGSYLIDIFTPNTATLSLILKKYDGSTETIIGTSTAAGTIIDLETNFTYLMTTAETHFAVGDILRLTVQLAISNNGNYGKLYIGTDPQNRDGANIKPASEDRTTQLKIDVPFKLNL